MQPEPDRIVCAESDFPHPIRFHFSKEGLDRIVQNRPGSDLDDLVRVWPHISSGSKPVSRNHLARFLAERDQPATSFFFTFRLGSVLPQMARIVYRNQRGSDLVLAYSCQVLAKRIQSVSKPVCKNHPARFRPTLPSRSGPNANLIRHVSFMPQSERSEKSFTAE